MHTEMGASVKMLVNYKIFSVISCARQAVHVIQEESTALLTVLYF